MVSKSTKNKPEKPEGSLPKTLEELDAYIDSKVEDKVRELLGDPDAGLELRPEFEERLRQALESKETYTAEEVAKKLGLK